MLKKRELVPGDMNVTILGFGGIPISRVPEPEALRVIEHALEKGINYFDTAKSSRC